MKTFSKENGIIVSKMIEGEPDTSLDQGYGSITNVYNVTWTYLDWFLDNHDSIQDVDGQCVCLVKGRERIINNAFKQRKKKRRLEREKERETRGPFHSLHQNFLHQISAPPLLSLSLSFLFFSLLFSISLFFSFAPLKKVSF